LTIEEIGSPEKARTLLFPRFPVAYCLLEGLEVW